jgi:hypothetical protein
MSGERDPMSDLDAAMAGLRRQSGVELVELLRAAQQAPPPAPTVIPAPEFPYPLGHPLAGTARFRCPLGCGWYHDEWSGTDWAEPFRVRLPVEYTREDIGAALTAHADEQAARLAGRVEAAFLDHYAREDPDR